MDNLSAWTTGPLGRSNFTASSSAIALAAVYSDFWFGIVLSNSPGLRLCYGATDDQVHKIAFALGSTSWSFQFTFNGTNSNAGMSGPHTTDEDNGDAALFMRIRRIRSEHGP